MVSKTEITHDGLPTRASRVDHVPRVSFYTIHPILPARSSSIIQIREVYPPHALRISRICFASKHRNLRAENISLSLSFLL